LDENEQYPVFGFSYTNIETMNIYHCTTKILQQSKAEEKLNQAYFKIEIEENKGYCCQQRALNPGDWGKFCTYGQVGDG